MAHLCFRREGTSVLIANIGLPAHPSNYGLGRRLHGCIDGDFKLITTRADRVLYPAQSEVVSVNELSALRGFGDNRGMAQSGQ